MSTTGELTQAVSTVHVVWESVNNGMDYWTTLLSAIADYRGIELISYISYT